MPENESMFYCDIMLGRLAKWLRILGYSCLYQNFGNLQKKLLTCARNNLTFLTRNSHCPDIYTQAEIVFIKSELPKEQIWQLNVLKLIDLNQSRLFSRCCLCNEKLSVVDKAEAQGLVPDYALEHSSEIMECAKCQKFYWQGTHHKKFTEFLFLR